MGESPPKRSERLASKPTPNFEERVEESDSFDTETEEQTFHVYHPTSAETQANKNLPHVSFHDAPRVIDVEDEEKTRLTNSPLYINVPEWSNAESSSVYEEIHEYAIRNPDVRRTRNSRGVQCYAHAATYSKYGKGDAIPTRENPLSNVVG